MFTTLVCVRFVATPMFTTSVYYFSMCTVGGHSCLLLVCTALVCVCTPVLLLYAVLVPTQILFGSFSVLTEERRVPGQLSLIGGRNNKQIFPNFPSSFHI